MSPSVDRLKSAAALLAAFTGAAAPVHPGWGSPAAAADPAGYTRTASGLLAPSDLVSAPAAASPHHRVTQPNLSRRSVYRDAITSSDGVNRVAARDLRAISRYLDENEPTYRAAHTNWVEMGFSREFRVTSDATVDRLRAAGVDVTEDQSRAYRDGVERAWRAFCKRPLRSDTMSMREVVPMAASCELLDGDVFFVASSRPANAVRPAKKRGPMLRFCWTPVEAPQVADDAHVRELADGHTVSGGVERDAAGEPVALHVYRRHPGDAAALTRPRFGSRPDAFAGYQTARGAGAFEVVRVPWRDSQGRLNVVRIMRAERPGQSRGLPRMRAAMGAALDAGEARDAGIELAKVSTAFALYITSDLNSGGPSSRSGLDGVDASAGAGSGGSGPVEAVAPGMVSRLAPGEKIDGTPPPQFSPLVGDLTDSLVVLMASSIGMSYELVTGDFRKTTYSSARAAIETAWPAIKRMQDTVVETLFAESFARVAEEAVVRGLAEIPGAAEAVMRGEDPFGDAFDEWTAIGVIPPPPPRIDVSKEIKGYIEAIEAKLTTHGHATAQFFPAGDVESVAAGLKREREIFARAGLGGEPAGAGNGDGDESDNDNDAADKAERDELAALRGGRA